jgi:hypothetical protein
LRIIGDYHIDLNQLTSHIQNRKRDCHDSVGSGVGEAVGDAEVDEVDDSTPVESTVEAALAAVLAAAATVFFVSSVTVSATVWSTKNLMLTLLAA